MECTLPSRHRMATRPTAYARTESASNLLDELNCSTYWAFADRNTSYGAPFWICWARMALEAVTQLIFVPGVALPNEVASGSSRSVRSEAAATVRVTCPTQVDEISRTPAAKEL